MAKIAVLENVDHCETDFVSYLNSLEKDEIKVVYSILSKAPEKQIEIHQALSECEVLCFQSSLGDIEQLKKFILHLLPRYTNIKEIRIKYLFSKIGSPENKGMLQKLNLEIDRELFNGILKLMETVKISEIFDIGLIEQKQQFFDKVKYYFDVVPLYYNKKKDLLWHTRVPYVVLPGDENYLDRQLKKPEFLIEEKDLEVFQDMMKEFRAMVDAQIESCKIHDFGDSPTLIKEKEDWLKLLDKYKI